MKTIHLSFHLTVKDYRHSLYYGFFIRNRKFLRIAFYVLGTILFYAVMCFSGIFSMNAIILFIASAYFASLLLMFASLEKQVLQQAKSPETFLKELYEITLSPSDFCVEIPDRKIKSHVKAETLYCAFEISRLFLIYQTSEQVFLIPKASMDDSQISDMRSILHSSLKDRFYSHALSKR